MRHVVEAGTDAASLLLFDPGALPADFDSRARKDPFELLEELTQTGRAWWLDTGADGAYLLHAYVDEPVPDRLRPYARDPVVVDRFAAPTGRVYFTGAEYGFRDDDASLRRYPHMGGSFAVRPGVYRLTLFRTEYPEGLQERLLREEVSPWAFRLHQGMGWLVAAATAGLVALAAAAFFTPRGLWLPYLVPVEGLLVLLPLAVSRLGLYRQARERFRAIEREFPSVVAWLVYKGPA